MTATETDTQDYCSELVRNQDEDRWLAAGYAEGEVRRLLLALYAFRIELRNIPNAVSEPPLGEIRLQWQREALGEIREGKAARAHPVIEELAATGLGDRAYMHLFERAIDAAARPLYGEGFTDIDDLAEWLGDAEGTFDELAFRLLGGNEELAFAAMKAGTAFALAREGERYDRALAGEVHARALHLIEESKDQFRHAPPSVSPALAHLSLTRGYLKRGPAKRFPLAKRLRLFAFVAFGQF